MQRLSSGLKNISAGSRPGDVAIVKSMEAGIATLEYGKQMRMLELRRSKWRLPTYRACQIL